MYGKAIDEYLQGLDDDGLTVKAAKRISTTDPAARWTAPSPEHGVARPSHKVRLSARIVPV